MGTSRSPAELAAKFAALQVGLLEAQRTGVRAGALVLTTAVRRELSSAVPSGRLRNVGRGGARVSVGFSAPAARVNPTALVQMRGPAHLIENPTKPHRIAPRARAARAGRATSHRAVAIPNVGMRASVQHPGTRGKHPWKTGLQKGLPRVLPVIRAETHAAMVRAFR